MQFRAISSKPQGKGGGGYTPPQTVFLQPVVVGHQIEKFKLPSKHQFFGISAKIFDDMISDIFKMDLLLKSLIYTLNTVNISKIPKGFYEEITNKLILWGN